MTDAFSLLRCPLCGAPLDRRGQSLFCRRPERSHCFDVASSGYVNLLPPGRAGNVHAGDDADMIRARSRFLSLGHYDPISDTVAALAAAAVPAGPLFFLDAGCGDGYQTCRIARLLSETYGIETAALGVDASKKGAETGARTARRTGSPASFAAGNLFALPVADGRAGLVLSLFAPIAAGECARVLRDDGVLLVGAAGKRHLYELRELLYETPREAEGDIRTPEGFRRTGESLLETRFTVPGGEPLEDLFRMTPFYWRTSREDAAKLAGVSSLTVTLSVLFRTYRKDVP